MPTKTIEHLTRRDVIRALRKKVSDLESERLQLLLIIGKSRFDDEPRPQCRICMEDMEGGGDFAVCRLCDRMCVRETVWREVAGPGKILNGPEA